MWHKPCRTFHPWCPCIKTRCLYIGCRYDNPQCYQWRSIWRQLSGGRLNIKTQPYQYRYSHYQDKTVWRQSYLYSGNLIHRNTVFILRQRPGFNDTYVTWRVMTASGASSDDEVGIMTTHRFQCNLDGHDLRQRRESVACLWHKYVL